ncbi:hypothetical protein [Neolewinella agarilytica]|uniref:hypothetical protein n=1 Tax=Neolewinella agarilytica TaxID=478744 RepID=UPI0011141B7B|nr:hypothetical protein [Neolewinella agarilytica]
MLTLVFITSLFVSPMNAQNEELRLVLKQLIEKEYLNNTDTASILLEYKAIANEVPFRMYLLSDLADRSAYRLFQRMEFPYPGEGHRGAANMLMSSVGNPDSFYPDREKQIDKINKLNTDLLELGIVPKKSEMTVMAQLRGKVVPESMVLLYYSFLAREAALLPGKRREQEERIRQYQSENIFRDSFIGSPAATDLENVDHFDLLPYFKFSKTFYTEEVATDPDDGFREIYQNILSECPVTGIELTGVSTSIVEENDGKELQITVDLSVDGTIVSDTFAYLLYRNTMTDSGDPKTEFTSYIISVLNKALKKKDALYRLYFFKPEEMRGRESVGFAYLTRRQYRPVKELTKTGYFSGPHPEESMSPNVVKEMLGEAQQLGLIPMDASFKKAKDTIKTMRSLLIAYNIVQKEPDLGSKERYSDLLRQLAKASRGDFDPSNFKEIDRGEDGGYLLMFDLNGTSIEISTVKNSRSGFYSHFLKELRKIVPTLQLPRSFYTVGDTSDYGNSFGVAYLNQKQLEWLKSNTNILWVGKYL